jgi:DeoR/GlpR family transcriptional regulator of sugar metabolism
MLQQDDRLAVADLSRIDLSQRLIEIALHERSAETIVLASSEKLLAASAFVVTALSDVAAVIVPAATPPRTVSAIRAAGVKVERTR